MTRAVRDRILKDVNGDISDHLRNHIHLTNCIHLKNHIHKSSPIMADRTLMRDLVALQRSRSLRDPTASPPSWQHSPSGGVEQRRMSVSSPMGRRGKRPESTEKLPDVSGDDLGGARISGNSGSRESYRQDKHLRTLSDQLNNRVLAESDDGRHSQMERIAEEAGINVRHRSSLNNRGKRRRFRGARRNRPSIATRDAEVAQNEMSVASNSFDREQEKYEHNVSGVPRNGCGIPWNWSSIHHRGKSFLDLAGRSLSCGLSDPRLRKGDLDMADMRVMSSSSSTKSNGEALPLLLDDSQGSDDRAAAWLHDYSGELGVYAGNLLKQETDSDLASEARFGKGKHRKERRHHQNLTQKYIPRTFRDLVGQNLVVQALSNAIIKRKIGLLYLFYGPHGTGKTSTARIFAKALNCQSLEEPKPCGYCNSCKGKARNVTEIGPVSNIVRLLDQVTKTSQHQSHSQSQFRVFIFDECDSVSPECWSAILKFIDRAPRRIVFVLVCSSLDALPHVIITRCQKFFFPKLKDADIIYTLQWIASKEDIEIDKDALKLIASKSDGSLRDAEMTLEQLSLLGKRVSVGLVQELVGLVSDEKLVDLLDLALSADTVNTVKNLRDIMESGVEPLALMSQLATVITDILAGSYDFTKERPRRKFFRRRELSKEDMEKLRQALKTLSEAEKQLRVSNDKITWLTAALLQLAPDQHYMLPSSSGDTSSTHSPLALNNASTRQRPRKSNAESSGNVHYNANKLKGMDGNEHDGGARSSQHLQIIPNDKIQINKDRLQSIPHEEIWLSVLRKIPINSVREFMYQEGKLISINYGAAPTVQLQFSSQLTKSKAEKFSLHILQAFESVLRSPVTIELRCESRKGFGVGPILLPAAQNPSTSGPTRNGDDVNRREIVEIEASPKVEHKVDSDRVTSTSTQKISTMFGQRNQNQNQNLSIVKSKVSLAQVIQHAEGTSQHSGWSRRKAVSIAEKLEQENLRLEPSSRRLLCWNPPKVTRRKLSRLKIRARKPQALLKFVSCGKCLSSRSPRSR